MITHNNSASEDLNETVSQIQLLTNRLERLSADSAFAHQASGFRGNLLRYLERIRSGEQLSVEEIQFLDQAIEAGFKILIAAGREIPGTDWK